MTFEQIIPYIDFIWLPLGLMIAHKGQHVIMAGFFVLCFVMMRMQLELMSAIGFPRGIIGVMETPLLERGLITYTIFYVFYLVMTAFSPGPLKIIFMAFSLSIFFSALFVSTIVMVL